MSPGREKTSSKRRSIMTLLGPFSLALLVTAGQIKNSKILSWIPIDLTALALSLVILASIYVTVTLGFPRVQVVIPIAIWVLFLPAVLLNPAELSDGSKVFTLYTVTFSLAIAPFFLLRCQEQRFTFIKCLASISVFAVLNGLFLSPRLADNYSLRQVLEGADTVGSSRVAFSASLVFMVLAMLREFPTILRLGSTGIALIAAYFAVSTGSRGPALSMLVALALTVALAPVFSRYRVRAVGVIAATLALVIPIALSSASEGIVRIVSVLLGEGDTSTQAREALWSNAEKMIGEYPFGAGWGFYESMYGSYPHNLILELGAETGIVVTAIFLLFIVVSIYRGIRAATTPANTVLLALLVFSFCNSMVSSDFNDNRLLIVCLFAPWAIALHKHPPLSRSYSLTPKVFEDALQQSRPLPTPWKASHRELQGRRNLRAITLPRTSRP